MEQGGAKLVGYILEWTKTVSAEPEVLKRKFEEVVWMNTVVYAVGGWAGRDEGDDEHKKFNGDFFAYVLLFYQFLNPAWLTLSLLAIACTASPPP